MISSIDHWDKIYKTKKHAELSWHQDTSTISLEWILDYSSSNDPVIDIGSGVSILANNLLENGYLDISLLEISRTAIETTKKRLQKRAKNVSYYNTNILDFQSNKKYKVWHDRAVFHFLTDNKQRQLYIHKLNQYLDLNGYFILATFSPTGPNKCSGLKIKQYDKDRISKLLISNFKLLRTSSESHPHPNGGTQNFNYFCFQKVR